MYCFNCVNINNQKRGRQFIITDNNFDRLLARTKFGIKNNTLGSNVMRLRRSDRSIVVLNLNMEEFKADKSYWKFNNSLVKDAEYVIQTKQLRIIYNSILHKLIICL